MVNVDLIEFGVFTHEFETGPGRNSVRIKSKNTYTTHVVVANINHMPQVSITGHEEICFLIDLIGMRYLACILGSRRGQLA